MRLYHIIQKSVGVVLIGLASLSVQACKDTARSEHNTESLVPDATDAQGRPIFSCSGDLCFDANDPQVSKGKKELVDLAELVWEDAEDREALLQEFRNTLKGWEDEYAACNYQHDAHTELIRVDCPEWVESVACPGDFYGVPPRKIDVLRPRTASEERFYCLPADIKTSGRKCSSNLACPDGEVCSGALTDGLYTSDREGAGGLHCVPADACHALEEKYDINDPQSCFYADFRGVKAPSLPAALDACDHLDAGTCARGCGCSRGSGPIDESFDDPPQCEMLTEQNARGICSQQMCETAEDCALTGGVCAKHASPPAWATAHYQAITDAIDHPLSLRPTRGFCVSKSLCDAWNASHDQQLNCTDATTPITP